MASNRDVEDAAVAWVIEVEREPPTARGQSPEVVGVRTWAGYPFTLAGAIELVRDSSGDPVQRMPQERYLNAKGLPLNRHGRGPFCDLLCPPLPSQSGVYVVTSDDEPLYVGMAVDLRERWGPRGYSRIHPRNCFEGGQSTNCKVNAAVLLESMRGRTLGLWTFITDDAYVVERTLIAALQPEWNGTR